MRCWYLPRGGSAQSPSFSCGYAAKSLINSAVMTDVTRLLDAAAAGDPRAAANLLSLGYNELRKFAAARRAAAAPGEGVTGRREIRDPAIFRVLQPSPAVVTLL